MEVQKRVDRVDIDFNFFKKLLRNERKRVVQYILKKREMLNENFTPPFTVHMAESGTDAMEREKGFMFLQKQGKYLRSIERALKRIDEGTYGLCAKCGKPIPVERLEAVPVTTKCINCKNGEL